MYHPAKCGACAWSMDEHTKVDFQLYSIWSEDTLCTNCINRCLVAFGEFEHFDCLPHEAPPLYGDEGTPIYVLTPYGELVPANGEGEFKANNNFFMSASRVVCFKCGSDFHTTDDHDKVIFKPIKLQLDDLNDVKQNLQLQFDHAKD